MDEIRVKNLEVFCHHGVYKEENVLGQKFLVNIVSKVDTRAAGKTDELELSVSYGDICRCVKKEMTKQNDKLLERVAERLAECILLQFPLIKEVEIEVKKPWAPVLMHVDYTSVKIKRSWHKVYIGVGSTELTVISSISYDHKAILGDTLEEIACQKAGIIKESAPVVLSENPEEVCKVVKHEAAEKKVHCIEVKPQDYEILAETPYGSTFLWKEQRYETKLPGNHQISNAVTALTASEYLFEKDYEKNEARKKIPKELDTMNIKAAQQGGIIRTIWPGRLEVLKKEPLFYRDGAHNPDGARKLASFLQKHFTNKRIIYIMGVLKDKEYTKILQYLMPMAKKVYVFRPNNERGLSAEILANTIKEKADVPVMIEPDVNAAVSKALEAAQPEDILVACGSLSFMEEMEAIQ